MSWRICYPANGYHLEAFKSGMLALEGIPRDYLVVNPTVAAGETETWSGAGLHQVTVSGRQNLQSPLSRQGPSFSSVFDYPAAGGGS